QHPGRRWYWLSLGLFVAAVLSKAMAVTLPAVLVILDFYPLRRLGWRPRTWFEPPGARVLAEKVPFFVVSAATSTMAVLANRGNLSSLAELIVLERIAISLYSLGFYLWKTTVPIQLPALYELKTPIEVWSWPFVLSAAVFVAITSLAILGYRRWPDIGAAWLCSLILFTPVLGMVHNGFQFAADRYTYLPTLPSFGRCRARPRVASVATIGMAHGEAGPTDGRRRDTRSPQFYPNRDVEELGEALDPRPFDRAVVDCPLQSGSTA